MDTGARGDPADLRVGAAPSQRAERAPVAPAAGRAVVAINARAARRAQIGGVERLAREMEARLPALRPARYRVVAPPPTLAHRAGHAWEQGVLPLLVHDAALIYSPANVAPLASARNVVVIHDVAALRHPEWYGRAYARYQRAVLPALAGRARHLITVSEFSRRELADALAADPARISVVPPGAGERFSPDADPLPAREAYGLSRPYALVVATRSTRKNLAVLRDAATALARQGIDLVAAGSARSYIVDQRADAVRTLGYVSEQHLPGLYAGARAFVLPSLYEGFGITCVEAMASGTPVVASDHGALPETCGDAALLVDPSDAAGLAEAVVAAATDDELRTRLIDRGRERAARFTWRTTAERTDEVLGRLLAT